MSIVTLAEIETYGKEVYVRVVIQRESLDPIANTSRIRSLVYLINETSKSKKFTLGEETSSLIYKFRNAQDNGWTTRKVWERVISPNGPWWTWTVPKKGQTLISKQSFDVNHDRFGLSPLDVLLEMRFRVGESGYFSNATINNRLMLPLIARGPLIGIKTSKPRDFTWKMTHTYVKVGGVWVEAVPYYKELNRWNLIDGQVAEHPRLDIY